MFWQTRRQIGIFYLLENEPEKAAAVFEKTFNEYPSAYDGMHVALAADSLGKTEERDRWLKKVAAIEIKKNVQDPLAEIYKKLAALLQKGLQSGSPKDLPFKNLDTLIADSSKIDTPSNLEYFVGMFLKNRGELERAKEHLIRATQSQDGNQYNRVLAWQVLRELKVEVPMDGDGNPAKK